MPMNPRLLVPRAAGGFNPASITGLTAWFDANNSASLTMNGSTVSNWKNLVSGKTDFSQETAASQPATTTLGSKTAIDFGSGGASAARLDGPTIASLGDTANNVLVIFLVAKVTGTTVTSNRMLTSSSGGAFGLYPRYSNGLAYWDAQETTARVSGSVTGTTISTTGAVLRLVRSGATASMHYNAVEIASRSNASGALAPATSVNARIQGADVGSSYVCGEMLAYSRSLTASEISTIEKALAAKWGITL